MNNQSIAFISTPTLETWDWRNPKKGIGGSETSHVEMAQRLFKRGFPVVSYAPIPDDLDTWGHKDPTGLEWWHTRDFRSVSHGIVVNYRDPKVFDADKPEGAKWWFVAQDVGYDFTPEQLAKVDRYICLCPVHAAFTAQKYPELNREGRIFVSSNGISSNEIRSVIQDVKRNPKRIMYASSPDRGLMFILENWFRIRERVLDAELHVFYGFHNMKVIVQHNGPSDWRYEYQLRLTELLKQPGVVWHDRVGQTELWKQWAESNIWFYPTDFPETSPVHGDTLVETLSGPVAIKDLVGKERLVYSCDAKGNLSISTAKDIKCTRRNAETITLSYKSGRGRNAQKVKTLRLTPDHEVMLRNGEYVKAGDLKIGDRVKAFHRQKNEWGVGYDSIGLTDRTVVPEHRFVFEKINRPLLENEVVDHLDSNKKNNEPYNLEAKTQADHASQHYHRETDNYRKTRKKEFTKMVKSMSKSDKSSAAYKAWETRRQKKLSNHVIVNIEKSENADVYCMDVYPDHNFIANGIVVHNCITSMEAQACGAIPVTTNFWALKQNVLDGYKFDGLPQKSPVVKSLMIDKVVELLKNSNGWDNAGGWDYSDRLIMQENALETFNWENIADQWERWIREDLKV